MKVVKMLFDSTRLLFQVTSYWPPPHFKVVVALFVDDVRAAETAAVEQRAVGAGTLVEAEAGGSERQERRVGRRDAHVLHQRVDALHGDIEVALEGALDGVVQRQVEAARRLAGLEHSLGHDAADTGSKSLGVRGAGREQEPAGGEQRDDG
ncbi:MAG: hypothetical protein J4G16_07200 [Acidobacteria bacterium]|nr:hypothetical protein [Acidobacteriota bacterium]